MNELVLALSPATVYLSYSRYQTSLELAIGLMHPSRRAGPRDTIDNGLTPFQALPVAALATLFNLHPASQV